MTLRYSLYLQKEKFKRYLKRIENGSCTVLLYHRVRNTDYDPQMLSVSPGNFEAQLKALKKTYRFISVEEFDDCLKTKKRFDGRTMLISFDDGYADNLHNALPILESLGLQAIFYIACRNLNTNHIFWWDELDSIFRYSGKLNPGKLNSFMEIRKFGNLKLLYDHYLFELKNASGIELRENILSELRQLSTITEHEAAEHRCLTHEELNKLSVSKSAVIGAHTINHLSLAHLTPAVQDQEITRSIDELNKITGKKIVHLSFPYGEKHNYNQDTLTICRNLKLEHAAANYGGYVDRSSNLYSFPRFVVRNDSAEILRHKLKSIL